MEHDGSSPNQNVPPPALTHGIAGPATTNGSADVTIPGLVHPGTIASTSDHGARTAEASSRIFCPVAGCPEASTSSHRRFRDFASIRNHLDKHCTGQLAGAVPINFLRQYKFSQCSECDKILSIRFKGTCPKCKPRARSREQINIMRTRTRAPDNNPSTSQQQPNNQEQRAPPSLSEIQKQFVPTIKNIPRVLRRLWAQCLAKALAQTVWSNNEASWTELLMLAKCTLCRPTRGGKSHLSQRLAWTRERLQRWLAGERAELWHDLPQYKPPHAKTLSVKAALKLRQDRCVNLTGEGGFSNACNALVSQPPLDQTAEVTANLLEKHPPAASPIDLSAFSNASSALVPITDVDTVEKCIQSFHRLSGGGPTGLRPIHLKNCLSTEYRDELLERCTSLVNILSKGDAPTSLAPFLAGATLTALPKKDDGIRPIAVGEVWRRLTAKCLCTAYKEQASSFFFPLQIGVGQTLGTEVGLETARQWCERNSDKLTSVLVKIDFSNAFNCVSRQAFLEQCRHHFPGLSRWAEWCYSHPSHLYFGPNTISSESGVQQGDPIGPLLFSLALQPLLIELQNARTDQGLELIYSYLDDLILAGEQQAVANTFNYFEAAALRIGLK